MSYGSSNSIITPELILEYVSEIEILEYYLGEEVQFNYLITSPRVIRSNDDTPGCKFWYNGNKIKFIDFAANINEDCFGIVKIIYSCNFNEALERIARDFKLFGYSQGNHRPKLDNSLLGEIKISDTPSTIKYGTKDWSKTDIEFWKSIHLNSKILDEFKVSPVKYAFVDNKNIYNWKESDPCYVYEFEDRSVQLYFPFRSKRRFITNSKLMLGWGNLPEEGDKVIITKSYKDIIVLKSLGYYACGPIGEGKKIERKYIEDLKSRFNNLFILYDNDEAGIKSSNKRCEENKELIPIFYPKDIGKDTSEIVKECGPSEAIEIIETMLN